MVDGVAVGSDVVSSPALDRLVAVANDPFGYAEQWKARTGRPVVGVLPMNFPAEMVHAAGALPFLIQEDPAPITVGNAIFPAFYCGFTRSLVDQAALGTFDRLDALMFVDNCVQLIGAADVIRAKLPDLHARYFQLNASVGDATTPRTTTAAFGRIRHELAAVAGTEPDDRAIRASIAAGNRNRQLVRQVLELRRSGAVLSSRHVQALVKSSMVMDTAEHTALLEQLVQGLAAPGAWPAGAVPVHLSGHMCQAPSPELLDLIEDCGAQVVNDDLFHGFRYVSTDVDEQGDPIEALARWYVERDANAPCPTRAHGNVRWDEHLLRAVAESGARAVISLLVKFCEPHMYYQPEVRDSLQRHGVPVLLLETEHEGMPMEAIRTRVESFLELVERRAHAV